MPASRRLTVLIAVCAAVLVPGITSSAAEARHQPAAIATPATDTLTLLAHRAADELATSPYYAGKWIDRTSGSVHVRMLAAGMPSAARFSRTDARITIEPATRTYAQLVKQRDRVTADLPALRRQGLDIVEWGPDEVHNTLSVSVRNLTPARRALLLARLGRDTRISSADAVPKNALFSRTTDASPYSAGIDLYTSSECTSGPSMVFRGSRYLLTASHCFRPGAIVSNGETPIGKVNWVDQSARSTDSAIITAPGSTNLYRTEDATTPVSTTPWTSSPGESVCFGGNLSGEKCSGFTVLSPTNYCSTILGSRTICGLSTAGRKGAQPAGQGDSGGPVYILRPRVAYSGMIVGSASALQPCVTTPTVGTATRLCSEFVRFQMITATLAHWGGHL